MTERQTYTMQKDPGRCCEVGAMLDKELYVHPDFPEDLAVAGFTPAGTDIPKPLAPLHDAIIAVGPGTERFARTLPDCGIPVDEGVTADQWTTINLWPQLLGLRVDMGDGTAGALTVMAASVKAELSNGQKINRFDSAAWRWRLLDPLDDGFQSDGDWLYFAARGYLIDAITRWADPAQLDKTREAVRYGMNPTIR